MCIDGVPDHQTYSVVIQVISEAQFRKNQSFALILSGCIATNFMSFPASLRFGSFSANICARRASVSMAGAGESTIVMIQMMGD
jgi:hypothetical protein